MLYLGENYFAIFAYLFLSKLFSYVPVSNILAYVLVSKMYV